MYDSFVAFGDSFTEGLDDLRDDGSYRGWADLVAAELAGKTPGFRYANLAVRGRRLDRIKDEQLPRVEAMKPAMVGMTAGGNDIIGFRCEVAKLAQGMHEILDRLARTARAVVVFTGFDPRGRLPMGRVLATRAVAFNAALQASSAELGAHVVDLWSMPGLYEPRMCAPDRLHLSGQGHALVARAVLQVLGEQPTVAGLGADQAAAPPPWLSARRADAEWVPNGSGTTSPRGSVASCADAPRVTSWSQSCQSSRPWPRPRSPATHRDFDRRAAFRVAAMPGRRWRS